MSYEAEDLEAVGKSMILTVSYIDRLLGIVATLSRSQSKR